MTILWLDTETFSECDLKAHGTPRYAEHPSTEITVAQWAQEGDEPTVEDCTGKRVPRDLVALLRTPGITIYAHNAMFDRTLVRRCWGIDIPVERWRCTMAQALAHGLPGSLDKLGQVLGLPDDKLKDKRGRELIQLFCKPRPENSILRRATRHTHPAEWAEFLEYSRQDIITMRAMHGKLPVWNMREPELTLWHLDQRINDRGFAVDMDLVRAAITANEAEKVRLKRAVVDATDNAVSGPSKRDELLRYILAEHGVALPDMRADTLRRRMEDPELPDAVKLLISIRLEATKTSTAKYKSLLAMTSADGRMRNTMQFCGAQRTGRWAHRGPQPGNMPRPTAGFDEELQEQVIDAIKGGYVDVLGDTMQLTSNCIRGAIIAPPGRKLVVADLANIEGRGLAWLAGEEWKLQAFRDYDTFLLDDFGQRIPEKGDFKRVGPDLYKLAYARSFGVDARTVGKGLQRQIGKVQELMLGYEGGVGAYLTGAATYNIDLDVMADAVHRTAPKAALAAAYSIHEWATRKGHNTFGLPTSTYVACELLKASWRAAHPATVALWAAAKDGVANAIRNPSVACDIGPHLKAQRDGAWLRIRLPSGRYLCYLQPKVDDKDQISYAGVNPYTRKWERLKTYGGKLVENCTQALARDLMAVNMPGVDSQGFDILLSIHDELITEAADSDPWDAQRLSALMSTCPAWAPGLPLAAAGFECSRYRKD